MACRTVLGKYRTQDKSLLTSVERFTRTADNLHNKFHRYCNTEEGVLTETLRNIRRFADYLQEGRSAGSRRSDMCYERP